jgi:hypothetical protein
MPLTARDVWDTAVRVGWASRPYDPMANRYRANADAVADALNEVLGREQNRLSDLVQIEHDCLFFGMDFLELRLC